MSANKLSFGKKPTATSNIDFEAYQAYMVEAVDCQELSTVAGYISGIIDLGIQEQKNAQFNVDKSDEGLTVDELTDKYADEIEDDTKYLVGFEEVKNPKTHVLEIKKIVKQAPRNSVIYCVDFPDIIVDKAQFFEEGKSDPKPLRLYVGGEFYNPDLKKVVISNIIPLRSTKDEKIGWTLATNSAMYKLAVATGHIKSGEAFDMYGLYDLLGKSALFSIQVFMKPARNGKSYYTEVIKNPTPLMKGSKPFTDVETFGIHFTEGHTSDEALKELRVSVLNTMMLAENWEESPIKKEFERVRPASLGIKTVSEDEVEEEVKKPTSTKQEEEAPVSGGWEE